MSRRMCMAPFLAMCCGSIRHGVEAGVAELSWSLNNEMLNSSSGVMLPLCMDTFAFQTNATEVQQREFERLVVSVSVERSNEHCGSASISYSTLAISARPEVDFVPASGVVQFALSQKVATIVVNVLPVSGGDGDGAYQQIRSFALVLEESAKSTTEYAVGSPFTMEIAIEMVQRSNSAFFGIVVLVLVLLMVGGFCLRGGRCLREAKVFQYKVVKCHQRASSSDKKNKRGNDRGSETAPLKTRSEASDDDVAAFETPATAYKEKRDPDSMEEDDELRVHLAAIQHLNDSLESLILRSSSTQRRRSTKDAADNERSYLEHHPASSNAKPSHVTPILSSPPRMNTSSSSFCSSTTKPKTRRKVSGRLVFTHS